MSNWSSSLPTSTWRVCPTRVPRTVSPSCRLRSGLRYGPSRFGRSTPRLVRSRSTSWGTAGTVWGGAGGAGAQPGQVIYLMGPGGAYTPDPAADWHLLAGDESALPAIATALEALPANAIGRAFIEVAGPEDEIPLAAPESVEGNWVYRGGRADLV